MLETTILFLFITGIILCVVTGSSILYGLLFGLFLFCLYAKLKGFPVREILAMLINGMKKVKNVLLVFVCIGSLTAVWRICGTIPYIVYHSAGFIVPEYFVFCAFLLCSAFSYLTGSSFATAGTVGTICMMIGNALGIPAVPLGGAILSGCYFGDRCSPMSSSALLVAEITETNIYDNVKTMFKTAAIPLIISCVLYLGLRYEALTEFHDESLEIFQASFELQWVCCIPAAITLILCICKVEVKKAMTVSTVAGIFIALFVQKLTLPDIIKTIILGFHPTNNPELSALIQGGGISSMMNVIIIICLSSSFSGIFERTGLLNSIGSKLAALAHLLSKEAAFLITAIFTCMICCNQSLAAILTNQLTMSFEPDAKKRASWLEDTVIIVVVLVPWSVASTVPLAVLGVPTKALLFAWYLYLVPIYMVICGTGKRRLKRRQNVQNVV